MARGTKREVGSIRIAPNGYRYIQTENGQRLLHHVLAEKKLGRPLRPDERVYFVDGDRTHVEVDNLDVQRTKKTKLNMVYAKLINMEKQLAFLKQEIEVALDERSVSDDSSESN